MLYDKVTTGVVIQRFNDAGEFISQEFKALDDVEYEIEGDGINIMDMPFGGDKYHSFNMSNLTRDELEEYRSKIFIVILDYVKDPDAVKSIKDVLFTIFEKIKEKVEQ